MKSKFYQTFEEQIIPVLWRFLEYKNRKKKNLKSFLRSKFYIDTKNSPDSRKLI